MICREARTTPATEATWPSHWYRVKALLIMNGISSHGIGSYATSLEVLLFSLMVTTSITILVYIQFAS